MRARSLKPSLFRNELLAVADPLHTLIFEGLWCVADRAGRLEDRPARLHLDINPGRPYDGTVQSLDWLAVNGFIVRYSVDGLKLIQVVNFTKHQSPHHREPESVYPPPEAISGWHPEKPEAKPGYTEAISGCHPEKPRAGPSPAALTPDSGLLTPESSAHAETRARASGPPKRNGLRPEPAWFVEFRQAYPERAGNPQWDQALTAAEERIREGCRPEDMVAGAKRYAAYIEATGATGSQYVKSATNFLGSGRLFLSAWTAPTKGIRGTTKPHPRLMTPEEIEAEEAARAAG